MGQTARATAGNGSNRGAQQCQLVRGAVVVATVGWDYINPARHGASSSGHPRIKNTSHGTPGWLSCCQLLRNTTSLYVFNESLIFVAFIMLSNLLRCLWRKWQESNQMLTKWPRHTRESLQRLPAAWLRGEELVSYLSLGFSQQNMIAFTL